MYEYFKGTLVKSSPSGVVVDIHGIGYRLAFSPGHLHRLPPVGDPVTIYAAAVYREDEHSLYGFITEQERNLFELFRSLSGIGPKTALAILTNLSPDDMQKAVMRNSAADLCKVPGIGKKTAEKLLLDLRDKLPAILASATQTAVCEEKFDVSKYKIQDAMSALVNLGYTQATAQKAIQKSLQEIGDAECDLTMLITLSLRNV